MNRETLLGMGFTAIVGLVIGYGVGTWQSGKEIKRLHAGIDAIFPQNTEIKVLFGEVKEVRGGALVIDVRQMQSPFENLPSEREVVVTDATKILRSTVKSDAVFAQETAERKTRGIAGTPSRVGETSVPLKDIHAGDWVRVSTRGDARRSAKIFDAVEIRVNGLL